MKPRAIIWSVVGIVAAALVIWLAASRSVGGGVRPDFSRDDLLAFAGRTEGRLGIFARRYRRADSIAGESAAADSCRLATESRIALTRALLDSIRLETDVARAIRLRDRVQDSYREAKAWLLRLEGIARLVAVADSGRE